MTDRLQAEVDDLLALVRGVAATLAADPGIVVEAEGIERLSDEIGMALKSFAEAGTEPPPWLPAFAALFDAWHRNTHNRLIGRAVPVSTPGHA